MTKKLRVPGKFDLQSILRDQGPLPAPRKPRMRKCELFQIQDLTKFKDIDDHAAKVM